MPHCWFGERSLQTDQVRRVHSPGPKQQFGDCDTNSSQQLCRIYDSSPLRASETSLLKRITRGGSWAIVGAVAARSAGLLTSYVLARILGKVGFGELGMVQSTVSLFGTAAGLGLSVIATRHIAQYRSTDPLRAGRVLGLATLVALGSASLMSIVLLVLAPWLCTSTLSAPQLTLPIRIASVLLFFTAFNGAQFGAFAGFEAFRESACAAGIGGVLNVVAVMFAAHRGGTPQAIVGLAVGAVLSCVINEAFLLSVYRRNGVKPIYRHLGTEWALLTNFSLPATLGSLLVGPATWVGTALLMSSPGGFGEIGIFSALNQWRTATLFLPGTLATCFLQSYRAPTAMVDVLRLLASYVLVS